MKIYFIKLIWLNITLSSKDSNINLRICTSPLGTVWKGSKRAGMLTELWLVIWCTYDRLGKKYINNVETLLWSIIYFFSLWYRDNGFYAFQSVFFSVIYVLWSIHSSYFISGFGARNKMIDLICSHIVGIVQVVINYLLFYRYIYCFTIGNAF